MGGLNMAAMIKIKTGTEAQLGLGTGVNSGIFNVADLS